jgi:phosphoglycerate kinase
MYDDLRKIQDAEIDDKTVVVRVNFDVPTDGSRIFDNTRIKASQKTIEYLLSKNCKIVLISHLGRPHGEEEDKLSLMDARFELGTLLSKPVKFAHIHACENSIKFMEKGEILLLENLRFNAPETSTDSKEREEFVKPLAELCDIYINDSFGVYREHASVLELAQLLPSYAGFNLQEEIEELNKFQNEIKSPFVLVLGGSKIDTKIPLIDSYANKVDKILVGGAMAYTFLKSQGVAGGKSKVEEDQIKCAKKIMEIAKKNKTEILLPVDHIAGEELDENTKPVDIDTQQIPKNLYGLDIGPKTLAMYREVIESAQTIMWNGPMGVFEWENFNRGTESIGEYIALGTSRDAYKLVGGSDTIYAINSLKIKAKRFNHVSIGGGMMLKYLTGETFSVLNVLSGKQEL